MESDGNYKRRHRITDFGLITPVILALILCIISFVSLRYVIESKDDAILNHAPDLIAIQRVVISLEELNTTGLGYLFTKRDWQRPELYREVRDRESRLMEQLRRTRSVLTTNEGRGMIDQASHLFSDYRNHLDRVIALRRAGAPLERVSSAFDQEVAPRYDGIKRSLGALITFKQTQFGTATSGSMAASVKATRLILLSGLVAIVLGAILSIIFLRALGAVRSSEVALREMIQVRDEFLSIASHELKNPITALQMQAELLGKTISSVGNGPVHAQEQTLVGRCINDTRRLSILVDELMDLTRLRLGRLSLQRGQVDLGTLVREVVDAHSAETLLNGSTIQVEAQKPVVGFWDPMRISQVAYNLISNAIKYGRGKPICVWVENAASHHMARLVVRDQGIGMDRETQSRIFRRFERGSLDKRIQGLGLGLYIVRQIVDAHGGRIFVRSVPGEGSTFIVELPYGEAESKPKLVGRRAA